MILEPSGSGEPLDEELGRLRAAVEAARVLGLEDEAAVARAVARRVGRRAGFPGSVYVMALAGGTGVGKSSVLNALAGRTVSAARAVRPTTDRPVAWVAASRRAELEPLLDWLKVEHVVTHDHPELADVAILDLPDVDSIRTEHRATVDALLPRIDAVTWVVDPEKYDDARSHAYWRHLAPHAERLRFILNKVDRLAVDDRRPVRDDFHARLVADGIPRPVIDAVSAATGEGIDALRRSLADAGHAKAIVAAKLEADRADAADRLASAAGIDPEAGYRPLLEPARRKRHVSDAVAGALTLVDPDGVGRQVANAALARARAGGGSLLSRVVALIGLLIGHRRRHADPAAYLRGWRTRGSLGRVVNPMRAAVTEAAEAVPAGSRARVLDTLRLPTAEADVARVIDRATRVPDAELAVRGSWLWTVVGALQLVLGAVVVFAGAWIVVLFVAGGGVPVGTVEAPILGPLPMPLALLAGAILASALLGGLLGLHARWVGRRLAQRIGDRVATAVREAIVAEAFGPLDRVEEARRTIAEAAVRGAARSG